MPETSSPMNTRSGSLPFRPRGARPRRVHAAVTVDENRKVVRLARWYGADVSTLLYFKSVKQAVRLHDQLFPKKEASE